MGFFTDVSMCWALGSIFWILLRIFAYAYITLWRFFGMVFTIRGKFHHNISKLLFTIFRVPHISQDDRIESKISVIRVSIITQSPVRAFLFTFAPLLAGNMIVFAIRMYLGNDTQERLILQIVFICLLLIVIVPSPTELKFVVRSLFHHPLRTVREGFILGLVIAVYVWEIEWFSHLPVYGTYLFEFGLLVTGFFLVELIIWCAKHLIEWIISHIQTTHQFNSKPLRIPRAVIEARKKVMFPGKQALRQECNPPPQELDPL